MQKAPKKLFYGWVMVGVCFVLMAVAFVAFFSVNGQFLLAVCDDMGFTRAQWGLFTAIGGAAMLVLGPFIGGIIERNPKYVVLVACILIGGSFFINATAQGAAGFFIASVLRAVGAAGATSIAVSIIINNWFGPLKSGTALAIATMGSSVGGFILKPVINYFIVNQGWRTGYIAMGIIALVVLVPVVLLLAVNKPEDKGLEKEGLSLSGDDQSGVPLKRAFKMPSLWLLMLGLLFLGYTAGAVNGHTHAYFVDLGYSYTESTNIQSIGLLIMIIGKYLIGKIGDKKGALAGSLFGAVTYLICFVGLLLMTRALLPATIIYVLFYAMGSGLNMMVPAMMTSAQFGNKSFGTIVGLCTFAVGMGTAIGDPVSGALFESAGNYAGAWLVALILVAGSILCFILSNRLKPAKSEFVD